MLSTTLPETEHIVSLVNKDLCVKSVIYKQDNNKLEEYLDKSKIKYLVPHIKVIIEKLNFEEVKSIRAKAFKALFAYLVKKNKKVELAIKEITHSIFKNEVHTPELEQLFIKMNSSKSLEEFKTNFKEFLESLAKIGSTYSMDIISINVQLINLLLVDDFIYKLHSKELLGKKKNKRKLLKLLQENKIAYYSKEETLVKVTDAEYSF